MWHAGDRTSYKTLVNSVKERDSLAGLNLDGTIILKWILGGNWMRGRGLHSCGSQ